MSSTAEGVGTTGSSTRILRVAAPLRHELIGQIRQAIASQEFRPGERLVERVLCERYGVSRTVVREALRHLEAEGLVTIVPNRGPVVSELTRDDAKALFEMRAALEALAASWFAQRATDEDREALWRSYEAVQSSLATGDLHRWLAAKDEYYAVMFAGAHNDLIRSTVLSLHARIQLLRGLSLKQPGRFEKSLDEIRGIAELAIAGKAEEAAAAAKAHVELASRAAFAQMDLEQENGSSGT